MIYRSRNLQNVAKLSVNTKTAAKKWISLCEEHGLQILIYETKRSILQQKKNVAKGVSQTMRSYHLVGQALDFVMVDDEGHALWEAYHSAKCKKAVSLAKECGFEWGGDWSSFPDAPHLQLVYKGYGSDPSTGVPSKVKKREKVIHNESLVDYLAGHEIDSSFKNRKSLASKYGIKDYKGTANQNKALLKKIKSAKSAKKAKKEKSYYKSNPKKVKLLTSCKLYIDKDFKKVMKQYEAGEEFSIDSVKMTKSGVPRLYTKSGYYLTANKAYVKKI